MWENIAKNGSPSTWTAAADAVSTASGRFSKAAMSARQPRRARQIDEALAVASSHSGAAVRASLRLVARSAPGVRGPRPTMTGRPCARPLDRAPPLAATRSRRQRLASDGAEEHRELAGLVRVRRARALRAGRPRRPVEPRRRRAWLDRLLDAGRRPRRGRPLRSRSSTVLTLGPAALRRISRRTGGGRRMPTAAPVVERDAEQVRPLGRARAGPALSLHRPVGSRHSPGDEPLGRPSRPDEDGPQLRIQPLGATSADQVVEHEPLADRGSASIESDGADRSSSRTRARPARRPRSEPSVRSSSRSARRARGRASMPGASRARSVERPRPPLDRSSSARRLDEPGEWPRMPRRTGRAAGPRGSGPRRAGRRALRDQVAHEAVDGGRGDHVVVVEHEDERRVGRRSRRPAPLPRWPARGHSWRSRPCCCDPSAHRLQPHPGSAGSAPDRLRGVE